MLEADVAASRLRAACDWLLLPLARAARTFVERKAWIPFGYARIDDHARERLDRSGRWVRDQAALGNGLERMPGLADAVTGADGGTPVGRVAALIITRVATEASVAEWIRLARRSTVRKLREAAARARERGSAWPEVDGDPAKVRVETLPGTGCGEDDFADRRLVRVLVPAPVRAAFDETLDLHRAVNGHDSGTTSFVEALVAEACAGPHPPDIDVVPLKRSPDESTLEALLARTTDLWRHLALPVDASRDPMAVLASVGEAEQTLKHLDALGRRAGRGDAADLDAQLRALIELENRIERRLGELLAEMGERGAWTSLMFRGVEHYAEQRLGFSRTSAADRVRLHRTLRRFPRLREAYTRGEVGLEAALLVVRMLGRAPVDGGLESAWVERAKEATIKRLRDETRRLARLKLADPGSGAATPMDDAAWHRSLRRDPGLARDGVRSMGEAAATAARVVGSVRGCGPDVFLRLRLPEDLAGDFLVTIESLRSRLTQRADSVPWDEPWPDPVAPASVLAARTFSIRCRRVPSWVGLLAMLEDYVATWDSPEAAPKRSADRIYRRDGWRCMAPGCTSRRNLEEHHVLYRSRGGGHDVSNRICLCRFHHQRGEHGELASCRGKAPLGIVWRLGRRDLAVRYRNERRRSDRSGRRASAG